MNIALAQVTTRVSEWLYLGQVLKARYMGFNSRVRVQVGGGTVAVLAGDVTGANIYFTSQTCNLLCNTHNPNHSFLSSYIYLQQWPHLRFYYLLIPNFLPKTIAHITSIPPPKQNGEDIPDGEAKQHLVNYLTDPTDGEDIPVLPIVRIGGIGKTTLAQLVFNEESVKLHFELRIWVCVTEDFDINQLMIKIIKSATGMKCKDMNKEELRKDLQDCLNGKRFFMVLDDVWNDDNKKWSELKDLLCGGAQGSRIIVTTRIRNVATITGTILPYDLEHLSYENCLSLFLKLAFKEGEEKQHDNLVRIGEGIVQKCKGVALAVKTLGSLLCSTRVQHDWELVRDSELVKLKQEENDILPALKLSYDHLPWYLKQCFAFCSVFPKDFEFNAIFLIRLWMANGFLQSPYENEKPEDIGNRYVQELLSRSFFQQFEDKFFTFTFKCMI
ncbi:putative disease resistance protein RGA3 [Gossypium hirsutum]|uniref:Disease resistance protein RGA3 n=1 Tax=Gossypium hirsutum TaxID=3635 RepID=A0ABM3AZ41_GOSHI|nr:putative disease resistance protein RGA3 [Gossypium hirsutum]